MSGDLTHFYLPDVPSLWEDPAGCLAQLEVMITAMEKARSSGSQNAFVLVQKQHFRDDVEAQLSLLQKNGFHVKDLYNHVSQFRLLLDRLRKIPGRKIFFSRFHCLGSFFEIALCVEVRIWTERDVFLGLPESREGYYSWGGLIQDLEKNKQLVDLHRKDFLFRMTAWQAAQHGLIHLVPQIENQIAVNDAAPAVTPIQAENSESQRPLKKFLTESLELFDASLRSQPFIKPDKLYEAMARNGIEAEKRSRLFFSYEKFSRDYRSWLTRRSAQASFELAQPPRDLPIKRLYIDVSQADLPALLARSASRCVPKLTFYATTPVRLMHYLGELLKTDLVPGTSVGWCYHIPEDEPCLRLGMRGEFTLRLGKRELEGTRLFGNEISAPIGWGEIYLREELDPDLRKLLSLLCLGFVPTSFDPNAPLSLRIRELFFAEILHVSRFSADRSVRQLMRFLQNRGWILPSEKQWMIFMKTRNAAISEKSHEEIGLKHLRRKKSFALIDQTSDLFEIERKLRSGEALPMNQEEKTTLSYSMLEAHLMHFASLLFCRVREVLPEISEAAIDTLTIHACGFPRLRGTPKFLLHEVGKNALFQRLRLTGVAL